MGDYCSFCFRKTGLYIYATCKQCTAKISYKGVESGDGYFFVVKKLAIMHQHSRKVHVKQRIMKEIGEYPSFIPIATIK